MLFTTSLGSFYAFFMTFFLTVKSSLIAVEENRMHNKRLSDSKIKRCAVTTTLSAMLLGTAIGIVTLPRALSQTMPQEQRFDSKSADSSPSKPQSANGSNAEVLQELEKMRTRIEQLEIQLKQSA